MNRIEEIKKMLMLEQFLDRQPLWSEKKIFFIQLLFN